MSSFSEKVIEKVGIVIIRDHKVLVVRKANQDKPDYFMLGGKMEAGESQLQALERELQEEVGLSASKHEYLGSYKDVSFLEGTPLVIHTYLVTADGEPKARNEIKDLLWIGADFADKGVVVASIMGKQVVPELVKRNLL